MLKKLGLTAMLGVGMLALAHPQKADAKIRFGISVGAPVYSYPVDPYYDYGYVAPYSNYYDYPAPAYVAPAPTYVSPYVYGNGYGYGYGWRDRDHERHEWMEHQRHEWREHQEHERREGRGWRR